MLAHQPPVVLVGDRPRPVVELQLPQRGESGVPLLAEVEALLLGGREVRQRVLARRLAQERQADEDDGGQRERREDQDGERLGDRQASPGSGSSA